VRARVRAPCVIYIVNVYLHLVRISLGARELSSRLDPRLEIGDSVEADYSIACNRLFQFAKYRGPLARFELSIVRPRASIVRRKRRANGKSRVTTSGEFDDETNSLSLSSSAGCKDGYGGAQDVINSESPVFIALFGAARASMLAFLAFLSILLSIQDALISCRFSLDFFQCIDASLC